MTSLLEQLQKTDNGSHITMSGVRMSWDEMWQMTVRGGGWVQHHGGVVACLMENTHEAAAVVVGALLVGGSAVSLPLPHRGQDLPEYIKNTVSSAVSSGASYILCTQTMKALFDPDALVGVRVATFEEACTWGGAVSTTGGGKLIQYSSGSTGAPKGIPLTDAQLGANVEAIASHLGADITVASWLPLSHDMGLVGITLTTWAAGGSATITSPEKFATLPLSWIEALSNNRATISAVPNFALELVLRVWPRVRSQRYDLSALRSLMIGGEVVRADTLRRFTAALSAHGMREEALAPSYGMAEVGLAVSLGGVLSPWSVVGVSTESIAEGTPTIVEGPRPGMRSGTFKDGVTEVVVSGETLSGYRVTADKDSTLLVEGPSLFDGYVGGPLRDGPHRTRDTGLVLENGGVAVLGRADDVIIVRGRNIHPEDIETACANLVRGGMIAAVADGVGGMTLIAEPLNGDAQQSADLIRQAATRASGVAASSVVFVKRGTLEKTPSGKVRRRSLVGRMHKGELSVTSEHRFRK
jgi:fatty-acyl-CoA synthase